ncbi:MAG: DUF5522 domain-containing protein [Acidobacteria bacterium]|nr:DUF5522 domain-containing protein [Acidobacteriota bacterium]
MGAEDSETAPDFVLVEGVDFYREGAAMVFTASYLLRRGYCCESGCRHCPYGFRREAREDDKTARTDDDD